MVLKEWDDEAAGREMGRAVGEVRGGAGGAAGEGGVPPGPELVERARRRRFSAQYKLRIVREADALLRREGLYSSILTEWRRARDAGALEALRRPRVDPRKAEMAAAASARRAR